MAMLDDDIMQQLRATFKVEAAEHIQAMNRVLLALEKDPEEQERAEFMEEIFRDAHSLKGAAGAAAFGEVEAVAHRLESVFDEIRNGGIELGPDLCDVLYDGIDATEIIIEASFENRPHGLDLPDLYARLESAQQGQAPGPSTVDRPTSEEIDSQTESKADTQSHKTRKGNTPRPTETIRVDTDKLDSLMTQAGELLVAGLKIDQCLSGVQSIGHSVEDWTREWLKFKAAYSHLLHEDRYEEAAPLLKFLDLNQQKLKTLAAQLGNLRRSFSHDALHLSRVTSDLGGGVTKLRMLPVSTIFDTFPRLVRDLARDKGKEVDLLVRGAETELDRKMLQEIKDPLTHIMRNSVDHGIEPPEKRVQIGKPAQGTITVEAFQKGSSILIRVTDDGAGIDVERVKQTALTQGLITADEMQTMSDEAARQLIFASGLSTSPTITETSGRGVGMDVVRKNIEGLHGRVDVDSTLGQGTRITLTLPLTLTATQTLLVQVGEQVYGVPISAVERIRRIRLQDVSAVEGKEAIVVNDEPVSLAYLSDILELPYQERAITPDEKLLTVILGTGKQRIAFLVDGVVGQQDSVVKSLGKQLSRVRNVAGATILGTGQVVMILNPLDLVKSVRRLKNWTTITAQASRTQTEMSRRATILVVDDSLITRHLEKNILEAAGYEVQVAKDGVDALGVLLSEDCDLVVSDIAMPRMDGFELTASLRGNPRFRETPVVLVTALDSREDKERGIEVGADAYIVKGEFDQGSLLQTVEQLI